MLQHSAGVREAWSKGEYGAAIFGILSFMHEWGSGAGGATDMLGFGQDRITVELIKLRDDLTSGTDGRHERHCGKTRRGCV